MCLDITGTKYLMDFFIIIITKIKLMFLKKYASKILNAKF